MHELTPDTLEQFTERFGDMHDAVLRGVEISADIQGDRMVIIKLDAPDSQSPDSPRPKGDYQWANLTLVLEKVGEFKVQQLNNLGPLEKVVMAKVSFDKGMVLVNLYSIGDWGTIESARDSYLFFVCKRAYWRVNETA